MVYSIKGSTQIKKHHTSEDIESLEKIQRRAARWALHRFRRTSSVKEMLESLEWQTLAQLRKKVRLETLYKFNQGLLKIIIGTKTTAIVPNDSKLSSKKIFVLAPFYNSTFRYIMHVFQFSIIFRLNVNFSHRKCNTEEEKVEKSN